MDPMLMLLLSMTQAGGGDPSSAYMDPVLAYMTGSFTPERRWSDQELLSINAPTLSSYVELDPQGQLVPKRGLPEDRFKEVSAILGGASPYDVAGKNTDDRELMDFLQSLAEERAKFFQQQISRDSRKDQFEEMGLPGYGKGYTEDQIFSMYGDYLGSSPQMLAGSERNQARLESRNKKLMDEFRVKAGGVDAAQIDALREEQARYASQGDAARADERYRKIKQLEEQSEIPMEELLQMQPKERVSKMSPTQKYAAALDAEKKRSMYSPGGSKYEAMRARSQAQNLIGALEASGRTPLGDALISAAMLKRVLGR
jgi:hypothetical protein